MEKNKKYLHLIGSDINIFCGKASGKAGAYDISDRITDKPLNKMHIYNALCVLFNKTPHPQKKKTGQVYSDEIFGIHSDIMGLLENTYFKISDLSGRDKFDLSKSGSHINNTMKAVNRSKMTNTQQLTWYDIKQYINNANKYEKLRSDLKDMFGINVEDSFQNCISEFHKNAISSDSIEARYKYSFEKDSIYTKFLNSMKNNYENLISDITQDPSYKKKINDWEGYGISKDDFLINIKENGYDFPEFDSVIEFIDWFRSNVEEKTELDKNYCFFKYNQEITTWLDSIKKNKLTHVYNTLTNNQIIVQTKDISDLYLSCNKTTLRGFESSKKFNIELKVVMDETMRNKLNNGLGYCTIGDGGLLKCIDYSEMSYHDMYGFVSINKLEDKKFWNIITKK